MTSRTPADRRLLGGLSPRVFLERHWQRTPLLVRGAVDDVGTLPSRDDLFELAARDDVESRVVSTTGGRWSLAHGPFARLPRRARDWTLLVQGVNLFDRDADALMRRFDFVSSMRLDDVMMSYAVDGGGVGPHVDSYDVFLLQVAGRRRWRWRDRTGTSARDRALVDGVPLKLLKHFAPTDEAILEPGDLLYLPPSCPHEGTAVGPCITASIGFRAPSWAETTQDFLFAMAERDGPDGRYADAGRAPTRTPGAVDEDLLDAIRARIAALRFDAADVDDFVGRRFSEPKPNVHFDAPPRTGPAAFARRATRVGVALDLGATMLYRGRRAYLVGEAFDLPVGAAAPLLRRLADRRRLAPADVADVCRDADGLALLHRWWQHGWLALDEPDLDVDS